MPFEISTALLFFKLEVYTHERSEHILLFINPTKQHFFLTNKRGSSPLVPLSLEFLQLVL
jgi:hypothetical protein